MNPNTPIYNNIYATVSTLEGNRLSELSKKYETKSEEVYKLKRQINLFEQENYNQKRELYSKQYEISHLKNLLEEYKDRVRIMELKANNNKNRNTNMSDIPNIPNNTTNQRRPNSSYKYNTNNNYNSEHNNFSDTNTTDYTNPYTKINYDLKQKLEAFNLFANNIRKSFLKREYKPYTSLENINTSNNNNTNNYYDYGNHDADADLINSDYFFSYKDLSSNALEQELSNLESKIKTEYFNAACSDSLQNKYGYSGSGFNNYNYNSTNAFSNDNNELIVKSRNSKNNHVSGGYDNKFIHNTISNNIDYSSNINKIKAKSCFGLNKTGEYYVGCSQSRNNTIHTDINDINARDSNKNVNNDLSGVNYRNLSVKNSNNSIYNNSNYNNNSSNKRDFQTIHNIGNNTNCKTNSNSNNDVIKSSNDNNNNINNKLPPKHKNSNINNTNNSNINYNNTLNSNKSTIIHNENKQSFRNNNSIEEFEQSKYNLDKRLNNINKYIKEDSKHKLVEYKDTKNYKYCKDSANDNSGLQNFRRASNYSKISKNNHKYNEKNLLTTSLEINKLRELNNNDNDYNFNDLMNSNNSNRNTFSNSYLSPLDQEAINYHLDKAKQQINTISETSNMNSVNSRFIATNNNNNTNNTNNNHNNNNNGNNNRSKSSKSNIKVNMRDINASKLSKISKQSRVSFKTVKNVNKNSLSKSSKVNSNRKSNDNKHNNSNKSNNSINNISKTNINTITNNSGIKKLATEIKKSSKSKSRNKKKSPYDMNNNSNSNNNLLNKSSLSNSKIHSSNTKAVVNRNKNTPYANTINNMNIPKLNTKMISEKLKMKIKTGKLDFGLIKKTINNNNNDNTSLKTKFNTTKSVSTIKTIKKKNDINDHSRNTNRSKLSIINNNNNNASTNKSKSTKQTVVVNKMTKSHDPFSFNKLKQKQSINDNSNKNKLNSSTKKPIVKFSNNIINKATSNKSIRNNTNNNTNNNTITNANTNTQICPKLIKSLSNDCSISVHSIKNSLNFNDNNYDVNKNYPFVSTTIHDNTFNKILNDQLSRSNMMNKSMPKETDVYLSGNLSEISILNTNNDIRDNIIKAKGYSSKAISHVDVNNNNNYSNNNSNSKFINKKKSSSSKAHKTNN